MPFDTLKIDRGFVRDIRIGTANYRITKSIIDLALALDKTVIAKGMETAEEADTIRDLRCHYAQGYWFAKPMPLPELATLQRRWRPDSRLIIASRHDRKEMRVPAAKPASNRER